MLTHWAKERKPTSKLVREAETKSCHKPHPWPGDLQLR